MAAPLRRVELAEHLQPQLQAGGDSQVVAAWAPAVEEPVAEKEREAGRGVGARLGRCCRSSCQWPQDRIGGQGGLELDYKVSTEEQGGIRLGTCGDEHRGGGGVMGGEELKAQVRLEVASVPRWADTVGEAARKLPCEVAGVPRKQMDSPYRHLSRSKSEV
jgi:hypothetical protein